MIFTKCVTAALSITFQRLQIMSASGPGKRLFEPVVPPKHFAIHYERRGTENAIAAGRIGFSLEPLIGAGAVGLCSHVVDILTEGSQHMLQMGAATQFHAFQVPRPEACDGVGLAPALFGRTIATRLARRSGSVGQLGALT